MNIRANSRNIAFFVRTLGTAFVLSLLFSHTLPLIVFADEAQPQLLTFYQYRPMYFISGNPLTKISLSIKTQIVRSIPINFGYTQLMMWDLFRQDPFFRDLNYAPEVFYRWKLSDDADADDWIDLGLIEHESNGKGGADERSWNRSYVRYHSGTSLGDWAKLFWTVKAWVSYGYNASNTDINQYRGLWEVEITLAESLGALFERGDFTFRFYPGGPSSLDPLAGGQELMFRGKLAHVKFVPALVGQIFHGVGENLFDYKSNHWGFRIGFGF
ncbi:MAG: phospholipase A [Bdellovibrionia bacterium]